MPLISPRSQFAVPKSLPVLAIFAVVLIAFTDSANAAGFFSSGLAKAQSLLQSRKNKCEGLFKVDTKSSEQSETKPVEKPSLSDRINIGDSETQSISTRFEVAIQSAVEIKSQIAELTCQAANCGTAFTWTATKAVPVEIWRIARFEGTVEDIREELILPLIANLRDIRENREGEGEALAQALARMLIYSIATPAKIARALPHQVVTVSTSGLAMGVIIPQIEMSSGALLPSISTFLLGRVVATTKDALLTKGLTLRERLDQLKLVGSVVERELIPELSKQFAFQDIEAEVKAWRAKNSAPSAE